jgi:hypothetical protein
MAFYEYRSSRKDVLHTGGSGRDPPTEAEIAHARKLFDEFQEQIDRVSEEDIPKEVSSKFFDDVSGTEYEGHPRN